jgi:hypothetical protein
VFFSQTHYWNSFLHNWTSNPQPNQFHNSQQNIRPAAIPHQTLNLLFTVRLSTEHWSVSTFSLGSSLYSLGAGTTENTDPLLTNCSNITPLFYCCIFVSAGTCLASRCSETVVVYSSISQPLNCKGCTRSMYPRNNVPPRGGPRILPLKSRVPVHCLIDTETNLQFINRTLLFMERNKIKFLHEGMA